MTVNIRHLTAWPEVVETVAICGLVVVVFGILVWGMVNDDK